MYVPDAVTVVCNGMLCHFGDPNKLNNLQTRSVMFNNYNE